MWAQSARSVKISYVFFKRLPSVAIRAQKGKGGIRATTPQPKYLSVQTAVSLWRHRTTVTKPNSSMNSWSFSEDKIQTTDILRTAVPSRRHHKANLYTPTIYQLYTMYKRMFLWTLNKWMDTLKRRYVIKLMERTLMFPMFRTRDAYLKALKATMHTT